MRVAVAALIVLALAAGATAAGSGATALSITIWPDERKVERHRYTLACRPVRGTLPGATAACVRLAAAGPAIFAPPPKEQPCIQIYGGPQRAIVSGTVDGRRIWVSLRRRDGCEIDRWRRLSFLLPLRVGTP